MIFLIRFIFISIYFFFVSILGSIYCIFTPKKNHHVAIFSRIFGYLSYVLNVKIEIRRPKNFKKSGIYVYIVNHQSNYDIIIAANMVTYNTITIGKKSLLWVPFFGFLYKLSGNLLVDRKNVVQSRLVMKKTVNILKEKKNSFWIFPEGTRNQRKKMLPFKSGAFYAAISAKVPLVPIVISNVKKEIKLNNWKNGLIIIEMLPPIETDKYNLKSINYLSKKCRDLMNKKFKELNIEVKNKKIKNL